jgi:hypothetical protein
LKTYLSAWRQLIAFHPSVFVDKSDLGLFITNYTFLLNHLRGLRLHILGITLSLFRHYLLFQVRH